MGRERHRRTIRLRGYDYTSQGVYAFTICTRNRNWIFGEVADGVVRLNAWGEIVWDCWEEIPTHFPNTRLDAFVVMPNHVHGIIMIVRPPRRGGACVAPTCIAPTCIAPPGVIVRPPRGGDTCVAPTCVAPTGCRGPAAGGLGAIIGSFKSAATRRINQSRGTPGLVVWQRNYYEQILRDDAGLGRMRNYIAANPARWPSTRQR